MAKVILDQCDAGRHVSVDLDAYDELYENLKKALLHNLPSNRMSLNSCDSVTFGHTDTGHFV